MIKEKNRAFNRYRNNSSNLELKRHLKFFQENLNNSIESSKQIYYCRIANKLNNSQKNYRSYWSLMKIFLNKKIPHIPPLYHENPFLTDFKEKTELFNSFFSKQCSLLAIHNELPTSLSFRTDKRLSSVTFSAKYIGKIIQGLDHNKAHGHDNISIRMLKICGDTICKPLEMIFSQTLTIGSFPSEWEKGNIVPIPKK